MISKNKCLKTYNRNILLYGRETIEMWGKKCEGEASEAGASPKIL